MVAGDEADDGAERRRLAVVGVREVVRVDVAERHVDDRERVGLRDAPDERRAVRARLGGARVRGAELRAARRISSSRIAGWSCMALLHGRVTVECRIRPR